MSILMSNHRDGFASMASPLWRDNRLICDEATGGRSGQMRVYNSTEHYGLDITRGAFICGTVLPTGFAGERLRCATGGGGEARRRASPAR